MIYDQILTKIENFLTSESYFSDEEIFLENQIPDEDTQFFARLYWTFGTTSQYTNKNFTEPAILNIDIYQRKFTDKYNIQDYAIDIRNDILRNFTLIKTTTNQVGKVQSCSIRKSQEQSWFGYSLAFNISIFN